MDPEMMDPPAEMMADAMMDAPAEGMDAPADMMMEPAAMDMAGDDMQAMMMEEDKKPLLALPKLGALPGAGLFANDVGSDKTVQRKPTLTPCCCCLCNCSNELTVDQTCLGCFPIKCGVISIGIFIILLTIYQICTTFFLILNEYVKWWFPFVSLLILIPQAIGVCFFIGYYTKDCKRTRGNLTCAVIMTIISTSLFIVWNLCYYFFLYKPSEVYQGWGEAESNYTRVSKKNYIFATLFEASILFVFLAYFMCVIRKYLGLYPKDEEEMEAPKDDAAKMMA